MEKETAINILETAGANINNDGLISRGTKEQVSDVLGELTKRVIEQIEVPVSVSFTINKLMKQSYVPNGKFDIDYIHLNGYVQGIDGTEDTTIADFNGDDLDIYRETHDIKKIDSIYVKLKVWDNKVFDAFVKVSSAMSYLKQHITMINLAIQKAISQKGWEFLDDISNFNRIIDFTGITDSTQKAIIMDNEMISLATESTTYLGTQTMETEAGDIDVDFDTKFASEDMDIIMNKEYASNYRYDVAGATFNFKLTTKKFHSITELDFSELPHNLVNLQNYDMIMIHKNAMFTKIWYSGNKTLQTAKFYSVQHSYVKPKVFKNKKFPMLLFGNVPAAPTKNKKGGVKPISFERKIVKYSMDEISSKISGKIVKLPDSTFNNTYCYFDTKSKEYVINKIWLDKVSKKELKESEKVQSKEDKETEKILKVIEAFKKESSKTTTKTQKQLDKVIENK